MPAVADTDRRGRVVLVPTPIGHLEDITLRALEVLRSADEIWCEDTRHTSILLRRHGIERPLRALHQHNEHRVVERWIAEVGRTGKAVAVVTDAGTPGVSDPGYLVVRECYRQGVPVDCLPGPTALIPALVLSGLPAHRFTFEGFLPPKKGRRTRLQELADERRTMVLYESPHRLVRTLSDLVEWLGADRSAAVVRELTKVHQEVHRGTLGTLREHFENHPPRGEMVVVVAGRP